MPSFNEIETSEDAGRPYERYIFQYGPEEEDAYKYTNLIQDIGDTWATPVQRDAYRTTGKAERDQLNITVPAGTELGRLVLPYPPPYPVEVTIYQGHVGADNEAVVWSGKVMSNAYNEKGEVSFTCESTLIQMKRRGPRRRWQYGCPLLLYGQGEGRCNANRDEFTVTTTVTSIDNDVPVLPADWFQPFAANQFEHGMIQWTSEYGTEYRTIRGVQDNKIRFNGLLRGLVAGQEVKLILGCNHKPTDCADVFDNILNYGGDLWIPTENPVRNANFW